MVSFNNLCEVLKHNMELGSKGITFINGDDAETRITYKELYNKALYKLRFLQSKGIGKNDELIFQIEDNEILLEVFWACLLGGIIPVPVNVGNNEEHKLKLFKIWNVLNNPYLITDSKTLSGIRKFAAGTMLETKLQELEGKTVFIEDAGQESRIGIEVDREIRDIAFIQFSSGSTSDPKGVVLTHENLLSNTNAIINCSKISPEDAVLSWMPLTHDMGMIGCHLTPLVRNINHFIMPTALFIRRPVLWLKKASEHRVTMLSSPNFGYRYLLTFYKPEIAQDWDLSNIRLIFNGAEPISSDLCHNFLHILSRHGLKNTVMYTVYGMAEASLAVAFPPAGEEFVTLYLDRNFLNVEDAVREVTKEDTNSVSFVDVGYAVDECEVRICDNKNHILDNDVVGNIQIRGRNVTKGYYNNPEATKKTITKDGWLNTGDLGFIRNGRLVITGRAKDIIFVNGQNYYPHDIERVAEQVDGIELGEIAASGVHNDKLQREEIALFILYKKSVEEFSRLALEVKKCINISMGLDIHNIIPVRKLPKTTSGKIQRYKLAQMYQDGEFAEISQKVKSLIEQHIGKSDDKGIIAGTQEKLLEVCRQVLENKRISVNDNFFEWGISSLQLASITQKLEEVYPGKVTVTDLFAYPTISKLAVFIDKGGQSESIQNSSRQEPDSSEDVAIIGMAIKSPMAEDIEEFWKNIREGRDCVTDFPESRRKDIDCYLRFAGKNSDYTDYLEGSYLNEIDKFDYKLFRVPPMEASLMNPNQRIFLETAWQALEDSGYGGKRLRESKTGVYIGYIGDVEGFKYKQMICDVDSTLSSMAMAGNLPSIIPSRISYLLDLKGPSMLVDTACSSSLVAVHLACQGLSKGDCDMAIAGGVKISLLPMKGQEKIGMESSDGKARTFDDSCDGTGMGEGVAAIVLKKLSRALEDGDSIYALIKGSAINQDGSSIGITAPNVLAQADVIDAAWKKAGVNPETISYIEAHGTGTKLGDPVEIDGIQRAFKKYTDKKQFCAIGSVKTNIGHLFEAAGIAGLIKSVLALKHGELPPSIHFSKPNREISFEDSPVYINDTLSEWETEGFPKRCGISSFGFSGTNCHVILEEAPTIIREKNGECKAPFIFTMSARSEQGIKELIQRYRGFMENEFDTGDVCYTANTGRDHYNYRVALIVNSRKELIEAIEGIYNYGLENEQLKGLYYGVHKVIPITKESQNSGELTEKDKVNLSRQAIEKLKQYLETGKRDMSILDQICELYIKGADIEWDILYAGESFSKARIPLYPLERERCWLEIPGAAEKVEEDENVYYTLGFKQEDLQNQAEVLGTGSVAIFKDELGKADELVLRLRAEGRRVVEVCYGTSFGKIGTDSYVIGDSEEDYVTLIGELSSKTVTDIIHMTTLRDTEIQSIEQLEYTQRIGVYSLYYLTRAILKNNIKDSLGLVLVSNYLNSITGDEEKINPENASMFTLGKVVEREYPNIQVRCVDIDDQTTVEELHNAVKFQQEYRSSFRKSKRYIEEFRSIDVQGAKDESVEIKDGGVYLITGGMGGIGFEVAKYLADKNRVKLGLVNRTKLPDRSEWDAILGKGQDKKTCEKIKAVLEIEEKGALVECLCADASNYQEMLSAVSTFREKHGRIDGVIHGAGVAGDGYLARKDEKTFSEVIKPKVYGTWILDEITKGDNPDFFIMFSSVASVLTVQGQGDYAAANSYMDSYAEYRTRQGKKTLAINWVSWKETGMAVDYGINSDMVFKAIYTDRAIRALDQVLNKDIQRVLIGQLNFDSKMVYMLEKFPFRLSHRVRQDIEACRKKLEAQDKTTETQKKIAQVCREVLGVKEIDVEQSFYDLGADSILLSTLAQKLEVLFPGKVTVSKIFGNPTIEKLANYIDEQEEKKFRDTGNQVREGTGTRDIAIIGMAARVPGADSVEALWENLRNGADCITEFPESRKKDIDCYLTYTGVDQSEIKYLDGGYLENLDMFDYKFFRLTPKEANLMDPSQKLFLETAWAAIEDAGYGGKKIVGTNTGLYVGYGCNPRDNYARMVSDTEPQSGLVSIPGNLAAIIPGRVSYVLDLKGPSLLVDTACSSSLVSVHLACNALRMGECDMAIAGGVKVNILPLDGQVKLGIESPDSRARTFDDSSDGTGAGEGVGVVVLKPLDRAKADGDNIYAVIKGSAVNQDGNSAGITAPNASAQTEVILRAWSEAGIDPETISYIEAHGTGTKLGDPIEIEGLTEAFRSHTNKKQFCALGSIKTNIGHLYEAAGIAGLIKAVLSLKNKELTPMVHFNKPSSRIDFENSPMYVNTNLTSWETENTPRRCGVSAFGLSGTNCHMILEEALLDDLEQFPETKGLKLLTLSAKSEGALRNLIEKYNEFCKKEINLDEICYTANTGRGHYEYRLAMIVKDRDELRSKLDRICGLEMKEIREPGVYLGHFKIIEADSFLKKFGDITRQEISNISNTVGRKITEFIANQKTNVQILRDICEFYVKGANIKWDEFYKDEKRKRVSLPVYQFDKERCWLEVPKTQKRQFDIVAKAEELLSSVELPGELSSELQTASSELKAILEKCKKHVEQNTKDCMIDRYPDLVLKGRESGQYTQTEIQIAQIWSEVLGFKEIDINDNYFEVGGDSIKAIQISSRLQKPDMKIDVNDFFQYQSVSELAKYLDSIYKKAEDLPATGEIPSTPMQSWYFKHHTRNTNDSVQVLTLFNRNGFDENKVKVVLTKITEHHDALRLAFKEEQSKLIQYIRESEVQLFELETMDLMKEEDYITKIKENAERIHSDINPTAGPLLKAGLFRTVEGDYMFIYIHWLIADDQSLRILYEEFDRGYEQIIKGENISLPQKNHTYNAWCRKIKELAESKGLTREIEYWKNLEQSQVDPLPEDRKEQPDTLPQISKVFLELSEEDTEKLLGKTNEAYNTETDDILLTALGIAIKSWAGNERVLVNVLKNGRNGIVNELNVERTIGQFDYLYPVILDMAGSHDLSYIIKVIKENLRHIPGKGFGYGLLKYLEGEMGNYQLKFDLNPQIVFRNLGCREENHSDMFRTCSYPLGQDCFEGAEKQWNFVILAAVQNGKLVVEINYNKHKYNESTVASIAEGYKNSLLQIIEHCTKKDETELTPSDLGNDELSIEEVQDILDLFK